jgi:hypothetical protein
LGLLDLLNKSKQKKYRKLLTLQEDEHSAHDNDDSGEGGWSRTMPKNLLYIIYLDSFGRFCGKPQGECHENCSILGWMMVDLVINMKLKLGFCAD